ncbi:hypothetical protein [Microbacterium pygmaeum]|uniref:Uncharacterized protein n=1 Tax=Microbacterium pygmaeum TaxID=370764 RepID=A0A1G8AWP8_9MICO|nr:hypothetical protein [Microbacterium pygmaeum]SDH25425.1 hypothetical protein SAMN04489810_2516 [Microbacterium pygmaeum]
MNSDDGRRSGYRVIRRVAGAAESPWPGLLVATADQTTGVIVDAAALSSDWVGWKASESGHVVRPLDVIRKTAGHDLLLPVMPERVADFLARRRRGGSALTPGEAVNLAVSLLRGATEALAVCEPGDLRGAWWLTDAGRPMLAVEASDERAVEATAALLNSIADAVPVLADAVAQAVDALATDALGREADRLEAGFFAAENPRPLGTTVFGSRAARSVAAYREDPALPVEPAPRAHWATGLARHVDAEWADIVSRATTSAWRALRSKRPGGRRTPWIAAAAVAAVVLVGGLLWPTGGDGPATADGASIVPSPTAADSATAVDDPATGTSKGESSAAPVPEVSDAADLVAVTDRLLVRRSGCGADAACLADVQESPDRTLAPGTIDLSAAERTLTLLDEFGGVAVLRADAVEPASPPQLVVVVRIEERWLLRDVHDVAQQ